MVFLVILAIPLIGACFLLIPWDRAGNEHLQQKVLVNLPSMVSAIVLAMAGFGMKSVFGGEPLSYRLSVPGPFAPSFRADSLSVIFVMLTAFLWFAVSIYTPKYMKHEGKPRGFALCTLLTLTAVMGIFLAGDLLTMLLFFELMTIVSFFWVIYRWNKEAIRAGYFYLFFSIGGGLLLVLGIVFMGAATDIMPIFGAGAVTPSDSGMFSLSLALFVVGFGVKAGMFPMHLWLPHAHSVAPTPASALLSGLLIKVGAYGLIRVGEFAGWGRLSVSGVSWLGPSIAIVGTLTMLIGVMMALLQKDAKRLLAYHSVSQMGYIILGLGIGLYMGVDGGLALSGAIYHIVNHALFKAALFLGVGIIYIHTKETNLYNLGGLWRRFPVTAVLMLLAVLGITGVPGLNGYASKTLLHHAVSAAAKTGTLWAVWAERLFLVVGVGTAASFSKLYYLMFIGKPTKIKVSKNSSPSLQIAMGLLAAVMTCIGIAPELFLKLAALPASQSLGMKNVDSMLMGLSFWNAGDIAGAFITLIAGMFVCWFGLKSGIFHWHPPAWLTLEGIGALVGHSILKIWSTGAKIFRSVKRAAFDFIKTVGESLYSAFRRLDQSRSTNFGGITLRGISADAALLIVTLVFLILWYTVVNPSLPGMEMRSFLHLY